MSVIQRHTLCQQAFRAQRAWEDIISHGFLNSKGNSLFPVNFFFFHDTLYKWFFPWRTNHGTTSGVSQNALFGNDYPSPFLRSVSWLHKMAQQVQVLAAKSDHLSFTLETHMMRGVNPLPQVEPTSSHVLQQLCAATPKQTHKSIWTKIKKKVYWNIIGWEWCC